MKIFKSSLEKVENEVLKINGVIDSKIAELHSLDEKIADLKEKRINNLVNNALDASDSLDGSSYDKEIEKSERLVVDLKAVIVGLRNRRQIAANNLRKNKIDTIENDCKKLDLQMNKLDKECDELGKTLNAKKIEYNNIKNNLYKLGFSQGRLQATGEIYTSLVSLREMIKDPLFLDDKYAIQEFIDEIDKRISKKSQEEGVHFEDYNVRNLKICTDDQGRVSYYTPLDELDIC